jgi:uncharacterized RmlC-like cupin family protein
VTYTQKRITVSTDISSADEPKFLINTYLDWAEGEGIPIVEDFGVNLLQVETAPWSRLGANAAFVHLKGRCDFTNVVVIELAPGRSTDPQRHLYEEVIYVLSGSGSTTIERPDGTLHSFEWGPKSLFALPLNARYRHYNASGTSPARLASTTSAPIVLNQFHNERFIFENPWSFDERIGEDKHFSGEGDFVPVRPGRHMWETNFVPDIGNFELRYWAGRGAGGSNIMFVLADGTMHAHVSEMPVGTYKKAHRHGAGFQVFAVTGHGYSLLWYEGDEDFHRVDWQHGVVYAPPDGMFHQHFNTSPEPARYLATAFGGLRYPFTSDKRSAYLGMDVSLKDGGRQIEYADQNPVVHDMFVGELQRTGVEVRMSKVMANEE